MPYRDDFEWVTFLFREYGNNSEAEGAILQLFYDLMKFWRNGYATVQTSVHPPQPSNYMTNGSPQILAKF